MQDARLSAVKTLLNINQKGAYSNLEIRRMLSRRFLKGADQAFFVTLVYGTLQNQMRLDWIIDSFAKNPRRVNARTREILRVSIYQLLFLDRVPDYAVLDCAGRMAAALTPGTKGFINAVLRNVLRHPEKIDPACLADKDEAFRLTYSVPKDVQSLYEHAYGKQKGRRVLEKVNAAPPLSLRVNLLKTSKEDLASKLEGDGFSVKMGTVCDAALFVSGGGSTEGGIEETTGFKQGLFTVQDEGAMIVSEALGAKPGERVLDMCAAPGGKTTHLAERMENTGEIIACDIHDSRLSLIDSAAKRLGHSIIHTKKCDGTSSDVLKLGQFDRILIDAPCSGFGVIRRKPEIKYQKVDERASALIDIQMRLLKNGLALLKQGGTLVYATCTVHPEENENLVRKTLNAAGEAATICDMTYTDPLIEDMDCFFISRIQKG